MKIIFTPRFKGLIFSQYSFWIFLFLTSFHTIKGQTPYRQNIFKNLDTDDGLSRNVVENIFEDSYGFIWVATSFGLNRWDGNEFRSYYFDSENEETLSSNYIRDIIEDSDGDLWIATDGHGICRFKRRTETFERFESTVGFNIHGLALDQRENLWVNTSRGLEYFDRESKTYMDPTICQLVNHSLSKDAGQFKIMENAQKFWFHEVSGVLSCLDLKSSKLNKYPNALCSKFWQEHPQVRTILSDGKDQIWIGTTKELILLNLQSGLILSKIFIGQEYFQLTGKQIDNWWDYIIGLKKDKKDGLWIGTAAGLAHLNLQEQKLKLYFHDIGSKGSLIGNNAKVIKEDRKGNLWIGTNQGISILTTSANQFDEGIEYGLLENPNNTAEIRKIIKVDSTYWIAQSNGLFVVDSLGNRLLIPGDIASLYRGPSGSIYVGVNGNGIYRFTSMKKYVHIPRGIDQFPGYLTLSFAEDHLGKIWIATNGQLVRYDPTNGYIESIKTIKDCLSRALPGYYLNVKVDLKGRLWIGTTGGLALVSKEELEKADLYQINYKIFQHQSLNKNSLSNNLIQTISISSDSSIWIGTECGINQYIEASSSFKRFTIKDGLPDNNVMDVIVGENNDLWIGTGSGGISHFDLKSEVFTNYSTAAGLISNSINYNRGTRTEDGLFIFVTNEGLINFYPDKINRAPPKLDIKLVDFKLYNESVPVGSVLQKPIYLTDKIELKSKQKVISFKASAQRGLSPKSLEYAFQLNGFDQKLQQLGAKNEITYTNLMPGTYKLDILARTGNHPWQKMETPLEITIIPPLWQTWWAYSLYLMLILLAIYSGYNFQVSRKLAKAEAERLREMDNFKSRFFTNITHEFRTPLTVVNGEAGQILQKLEDLSKNEVIAKAKSIQRNGSQLLRLVDRMLSLAQLEAGKLKINQTESDLIAFLKYVVEAFHALAKDKGIELKIEADHDQLITLFDNEKMEHILGNLISNAIKFTNKGGKVLVSLDSSQVFRSSEFILQVKDNGIGIAKKDLPNIFDRFYQAKNTNDGNGIGLSLTKELVHLLNGQISVESTLGKGTSFQLRLPFNVSKTGGGKNNFNLPNNEIINSTLLTKKTLNELPLILIIEDNLSVRQYLIAVLDGRFEIHLAKDGNEGLQMAYKLSPNLIICDIMMPGKDGFEVCNQLKSDPITNHIPIIVLTAKVDYTSKLKGIELGADLYLPKPFDEKELLGWIRNRLKLHQDLEKKYNSPEWLAKSTYEDQAVLSEPEKLMQTFIQFVKENIENPNLKISFICKALQTTEPTLARKVKAYTGKPIGRYIITIRMALAKQLLNNGGLNISEVAYKVGYRDPNTFSRYFKKEVGKSPREYKKDKLQGANIFN